MKRFDLREAARFLNVSPKQARAILEEEGVIDRNATRVSVPMQDLFNLKKEELK